MIAAEQIGATTTSKSIVRIDSRKADLASLLSYRLSIVSSLLSRSQLKRFASVAEVSQPEWRVLVLVERYGPLSVKGLSNRAGLDFAQVSRLVSRMTSSGYVVKERTADARSVNLSLTVEGKALERQLWQVAMQCNTDFLSALSRLERKVLIRALDVLSDKAKESLDTGRAHARLARRA